MPANLFQSYVAGDAGAFYAGVFTNPTDRRAAVDRAQRPIAPQVLGVLASQNAKYGPSRTRQEAIVALEHGAAAVVTGQQVGLFLGPLYTVYKAASAIRVAQALAAESGKPVVPIFWLQTEDHDLVEIASTQLARPQREPLQISVPAPADNRYSIAQLRLPAAISDCTALLERELGALPHASEHLERLRSQYRPDAPLAAAFAHVLAELFEPEGLLLLDPRDARLAAASRAVHGRALRDTAQLAEQLNEQCARLERAGFSPEVHVRPGAPLSFYHPEGEHGPRYRLAPSANGFAEVGANRTHTLASLLEHLERDPLCVSSSALLRPIVQDSLLPTAAYVGGPSEIAYFAQLEPLYAAFGLPMPLVVPRARIRLLEAGTRRSLERLGLHADDLALPESALAHKLATARSRERKLPPPAALTDTLCRELERVLEAHLRDIISLDPQLAAARDKTRDKLRSSVTKLGEKYASVLARHDQAQHDDLTRARWALQPGGVPQERCYGFAYYAARYGERALIERILALIEPFDATPKELAL